MTFRKTGDPKCPVLSDVYATKGLPDRDLGAEGRPKGQRIEPRRLYSLSGGLVCFDCGPA